MMHTKIFASEDGTRWQRVQYYLSPKEEFEIVMSVVKAFIFGGCPAQHMSEELEYKLCCSHLGHRIIDDDLGPIGKP